MKLSKEIGQKGLIKEIFVKSSPSKSQRTCRYNAQKAAAHVFKIKEGLNRMIPLIHDEATKEILNEIIKEAAKL